MPQLEARQYAGATDLELLLGFVRNATAARWPRRSYLHVGDIIWRLCQESSIDQSGKIRLWIRDGDLVGFVWFNSPENVEIDALPGLGSDPLLTDEMLTWAEEHRQELGTGNGWWDPELEEAGPTLSLVTNALDQDGSRIDILEDHGFNRINRHGVLLRHRLESPISDSRLPQGASVRHITEADIAERVDTHLDAWSHLEHIGIPEAKPELTVSSYQRLRASPLYDSELDLVVELPEGGFATCCICWMDTANGLGFFEPVGTRNSQRRKGLARAMILEGLRRLRARGAHTVNMGTASINEPAIALYHSCGFTLDDRDHWYVKHLD